jgi:predicted O-methyltransferase YrrM
LTNKFFQLKTYITYWLDAVNEHSLHSPFFFDLYSKTLLTKDHDLREIQIEDFRRTLLNDSTRIVVNDLGAGSACFKSSMRSIKDIAKTSLSPKKYSLLYRNIIKSFDARVILELGTSLGINALYLASPSLSHVTTLEGSQAVAERAQTLFHIAGACNIKLIVGDIKETLPSYLKSVSKVDFVLLDANHRYVPTLDYFEQLIQKVHERSVIVIDDIHYSPEMERAWRAIKKYPEVCATGDIYRCGMVFFNPTLNKQHIVLEF